MSCLNAEGFASTAFSNKTSAVFDPFQLEELEAIAALVRANLSLAEAEPEDMVGDWLYAIENLPAPKSAVLAYLDGNGSYPGRFARAIVVFAANESSARLTEFRVGPIKSFPLGNSSIAITPMMVPPPHNSTDIPYGMRPVWRLPACGWGLSVAA